LTSVSGSKIADECAKLVRSCNNNASAILTCMEIRCNICDEVISSSFVDRHVASRNHAVRKKVVEFHEMNAQIKSPYQNDMSVVRTWIKDLYNCDFLSVDKT
jgi:hypothetical protein